MEIWKLLLITLLSAVLLGCLSGVLLGKHLLKKKSGHYKPLLNRKERILFSICILLGCASIATGLFLSRPTQDETGDGAVGDGMTLNDGVNGAEAIQGGDVQAFAPIPPDDSSAVADTDPATETDGEEEPGASGDSQQESEADAEDTQEGDTQESSEADVSDSVSSEDASVEESSVAQTAEATPSTRPRSAPSRGPRGRASYRAYRVG